MRSHIRSAALAVTFVGGLGTVDAWANDPPVAVNDTYATTNADNLSVDAPGVLQNDVDTDPLTAILVSSSQAQGTLKLYPDGSFEYEVPNGFVGTDVFTYKANDGTQDSNLATVTFNVTAASTDGAYTDEAAFLSALATAGYCTTREGFEGDEWVLVRSSVVDGFFAQPNVWSKDVTWSPRSPNNGVTTGSGAARSGAWGTYSYPHTDYTNGYGDGVTGQSSSKLVAVGGWVRTNTPPAKVRLYIDGASMPIDFGGNASTLSTGYKFFGFILPAGFQRFEFREEEGTATDAKLLFFDDFTFGYDLTDDCNGNSVPDACDIANGVATDCDRDGVPDGCGPDCDNNGTPDACDVLVSVSANSGPLSPIGAGSPQSLTIPSAPAAVTDVGLRFWTKADVSDSTEYFAIDVNGTAVGFVFTTPLNDIDCNPNADYDQVVVDAATFNAAVAGGDAVIHVVPSSGVSTTTCSGSFVTIEALYVGSSASDADGSGVPDACEVVCQADIGFGGPGNAMLSICGGDLSPGTTADLSLTNAAPSQLALLLASTQQNPTPFAGGFVVPIPPLLQIVLPIDPSGEIHISGLPGGNVTATAYLQAIYTDPAQALGYGISNALQIAINPP